jgi:hypothetical protein
MVETIRQRIALVGEAEIKRQLREVGAAGESAFRQIEQSSARTHPALSGISRFIGGFRQAFQDARRDAGDMERLNEQVGRLGERFSFAMDRFLPRYRELIGLGGAAGVAGLAVFISEGARAADEIGKMAEATGLGVRQFQALQYAAENAGIGAGEFVEIMGRLNEELHKGQLSQLGTLSGLAQMAVPNMPLGGVQVIRGGMPQAQLGPTVIRGGQAAAGLVGGAPAIQEAIERHSALGKEVVGLSREMTALAKNAGVLLPQSLSVLAHSILRTAGEFGPAGEKMRESLRAMGLDVPPVTTWEALRMQVKGFQMDLGRLVPTWKLVHDRLGDHLVPKTLQEALGDIADRLRRMPAQMRAAFAYEHLGGRYGARLLPLLSQGREEIQDMIGDLSKLGILITPAQTVIGAKLVESLTNLRHAVANTRTALAIGLAPAMKPALDALTQAIGGNMQAIEAWAGRIAAQAAPGMIELAHAIEGTIGPAQVQTQWVKTLIGVWEGFRGIATNAAAAFQYLGGWVDYVAQALNRVFGTHFTGQSLLWLGLLGKVTGAFGLLRVGVGMVIDIFRNFVSIPFAFLGQVVRDFGLIWRTARLVGAGVRAAVEGFKLMRAAMTAVGSAEMFAPLLAALGPAGAVIAGLAAIGAVVLSLTGQWGGFFKFMEEGWENLVGTVKAFIFMVESAAKAFGRLLHGGAAAAAGAGGPIVPGYAAGGLVGGRGATDSVWARLTPGEFVLRPAAVAAIGLSSLAMLNSGALAPPSLRFANGGLVPGRAAAGRAHSGFTIVLDGKSFRAQTDRETAEGLVRTARNHRLAQIGRKPSWAAT